LEGLIGGRVDISIYMHDRNLDIPFFSKGSDLHIILQQIPGLNIEVLSYRVTA